MRIRVRRLLGTTVVAALGAATYALGCGPWVSEYRPLLTVAPADRASYAQGAIGVVRPHFARKYLVQAYRRFNGQPPLANLSSPDDTGRQTDPLQAWLGVRAELIRGEADATSPSIDPNRDVGDYSFIVNCPDGAFQTAAATAQDRRARYGAESAAVREWVRAQDAVFTNCRGGNLVLPKPASAGSDALARSDRAYQTAAAYLYGMHYAEAIDAFHAIANDASSPWRPYGRYLAARATIREATTPREMRRDLLERAEGELRAVLDDRNAAVVHDSTRGLLQFIASRLRPVERVRELSDTLVHAPTVRDDTLFEYQLMMDKLLGDTTRYAYADIADRDAIAASADLNDWIMVMQASGDRAIDRAVTQWKRTHGVAWLVAALWKVPPGHADSGALLEGAAAVDSTSPAFATVAFLRARALADAGNATEARAVLAALPAAPQSGFDMEAINAIAALRTRLAASLDELLRYAPRTAVATWEEDGNTRTADPIPVFDADGGIVFSERLPLARLMQASASSRLPARLRLHVASAAFTRAVILKREQEAVALVPVLRSLAPSLAPDLDRIARAPAPDRHIAIVRFLLRTPGMRVRVSGVEEDGEAAAAEPSREFDHMFRYRNWWCGAEPPAADAEHAEELASIAYPGGKVGFPVFLTEAERKRTQDEIDDLNAMANAIDYLSAEAVRWANARPKDADAAEALAHVVEGTRWSGCGAGNGDASHAAFTTLHRLFPASDWAKRTRYWYR